jgi:hypothetical protein
MRRIKSCRSVAATRGADVIAEGVELTDPDKSDDAQYWARVGDKAYKTGLISISVAQ